jgi:hypothetical protein
MKTQLGLYFEVTTADALRARAVKHGAAITDLAELCVRFGLSQLSDDQVNKWLAQQKSTRGRLAGGLRISEKACVAALESLRKKEPGAYRFGGVSIANEAGLRFAVAYQALKSLAARGMVKGSDLEPLDRWGRPVKSIWSLTPPDQRPVT